MPLKKENHADYLARAAYARDRADAATIRRERRDWLTIASEWTEMAEAFERLEEMNLARHRAESENPGG